MRILLTLAIGLNLVALSRADNFLELYESAPQFQISLEDVHFTPEEEARFKEEFRIENEQTTKELLLELDLIYEERMEQIRAKRLQSVALPKNFVDEIIQDPFSGEQVYQYFDENIGIVRLLSIDNAVYFIYGVICAYLSKALKSAVIDEINNNYSALVRFKKYIKIFVDEYNASAGYKRTMKNVATIYDSLKKNVRSIIEKKLAQGIKGKIIYLAKTYLGINFILDIATIAWRVTSNILKISSNLSSAYDWYSVADNNDHYYNSGWFTGQAAKIVFT